MAVPRWPPIRCDSVRASALKPLPKHLSRLVVWFYCGWRILFVFPFLSSVHCRQWLAGQWGGANQLQKENADTAKKGLGLQVMWVNLWSTCLCWHSSGAIGVLHSAGPHLVRPLQQQLVGLISPARAVLRSSLHKLLQTAAAGLDRDLQRTTVSSADWRSGTESMLAFNQISVIKLSARLLPRWQMFSRAFTTSFFLKMAR